MKKKFANAHGLKFSYKESSKLNKEQITQSV